MHFLAFCLVMFFSYFILSCLIKIGTFVQFVAKLLQENRIGLRGLQLLVQALPKACPLGQH